MDTGGNQLIRTVMDDSDINNLDIPMTSEDRERVLWAVRQMDFYARHNITDPSVDATARARCLNRFRMCAEWASRGMCLGGRDDVLFAMNACPLACRTCEWLTSFHRCAGRRGANVQPSFRPGGIGSLFEGKGLPGGVSWAQYEPLFVAGPIPEEGWGTGDPHVVLLKQFLSDEEADHLQSLGSTVGWSPSSISGQSVDKVYAGRARCQDNYRLCNRDVVYQRIMHRISSIIGTNTTIHHLEPLEIVHLRSDAEIIRQHNFETSSFWKPAGPRVLSLFIYLSDVGKESGGELAFPDIDWLTIRPKKGMAVLWNNVKDENLLYPAPTANFELFPAREGNIFGANVHVRLYNWTDAAQRGCA
ncbi:hypothetical protein ACHAWF_002561 [Thalassiosira exigua]